jgi:hypothetical protein
MHGLFLVGDFNTLRTDQFAKCLNLVQVVDKPTRKANVLDMIFTNCRSKYNSPRILPPVGASDHNCILLWPASIPTSFGDPKYVLYRPLSDTVNLIADALYKVPWHHMYQLDDCQMQTDFFYSHMYSISDHFAPVQSIKFSQTDRPWITVYFKVLDC